MAKVKHFSAGDLDLKPAGDGPVHAVVNAGYSAELGAGIGVFENCTIPWTVTYDEVLFIKDGRLDLRVGKKLYRAGPGDILWIPAGTALGLRSEEEGDLLLRHPPRDQVTLEQPEKEISDHASEVS